MRLFLRNLLFAALVLALLIKIYVWYRVSSAVDRLQSLLLPVGTLSRSSVSTSLNGDVSLNGLQFYPTGADTGGYINIDDLTVHTPGLHYLLGLGGTVGSGQFPEYLGLSLSGFRIGPGASTALSSATQMVSGNPFEAIGCGSLDFFAPFDLQAMGYTSVAPDIHAEYQLLNNNRRLDLVIESSTRKVSSIRFEAELAIQGLESIALQQSFPRVVLTGMTLKYQDAAFNERRNEYCADINALDEAAYLDQHVEQVSAALRRKRIVAGSDFMRRYRLLMEPSAELEVWSSPPRELLVSDLQGLSLKEAVSVLGLSLSVNGVLAESLDLEFDATPESQISRDPDSQSPTVADRRAVDPAPRRSTSSRPDPALSLKDTAVDQIARYIGKRVVINTTTGRLYQGYVDAVSQQGRVMLTLQQRGGTAQVPIQIDQIERLRVFR